MKRTVLLLVLAVAICSGFEMEYPEGILLGGVSSKSKSPFLNFANHLCAVKSPMTPSPYTSRQLSDLNEKRRRAGQRVNLFRVSDEFAKRALTYDAPKLEPNVQYGNFFDNISKTIQNLFNEVILEFYRQIRFQSYMLSNTLLSIADEFEYHLEMTNSTDFNPYLDTILKKLNTRLKLYVGLNPGRIGVLRETLPEIANPDRVWSFVTYHPLKQLFSNLESTLDLHLANINVLIDTFYKRGWEAARYYLPDLQEEFREVYLNGYLLCAYSNAIKSIYAKAAKIQRNVKPETWKEFQTYGYYIREIYEKIKPDEKFFSQRRLRVING